MSTASSPWPEWQRWQRLALVVAAGGAALCAVGAVFSLAHFFRAYLIAFLYWLGITLGSFAVLMIHNLTGGRWGVILRRLLEASTKTLPLMAILFVPLLAGLGQLYPWSGEIPFDNHVLQEKTAYLNVPFFVVRALVYFLLWIVFAFVLNRWSAAQEEEYDRELSRRMQRLGGPGLVAYGLGITFAAVDWIMSLEPEWYSSIFGVIVGTGQLLAGLAFAIFVLSLLSKRPPLSDLVTPALWNDLGNLLLAFVMIWTYVSFSQFLLIWSGNLEEETVWYRHRSEAEWEAVSWLILLCNFALPFLALLMRDVKRRPERLAAVAAIILVLSFIYQVWLVAPSLEHSEHGAGGAGGLAWIWLDAAAVCALGGVWLAAFLALLQRWPLTPRPDPEWEEAPHG